MWTDVPLLIVSALVGAIVSTGFQWLGAIRRRAKAAQALRADLGVIYRHIEASIRNLERPADVPGYQLVARIRYAMFKDSPLSPSQLEFITTRGLTDKAKIIQTWMRNSDILLEELALRIEGLDAAGRAEALGIARENLVNLREFLDTLGLRDLAVKPSVGVELAVKVDKRLQERKQHES
ncbi:MAG: hypothetical protein ACK4P8_00590 [Tabrizicola sp.]